MYWDKAKNIVILFLLLINAVLAVLVYTHTDNYTLTSTQLENINKVLSANNVMLYTPVLKEYKPMKAINMLPYSYSNDRLIEIFFTDPEQAKPVIEYGRDIFTDKNSRLTVENGIVTYETQPTYSENPLNETDCKSMCNGFLTANSALFPNFVFDKLWETELGFSLRYIQNYRGELIYSNYILFDIIPGGISRIEFSYSKISGYDDKTREICPADEALFVFMQYFRNNFGEKEVFIDRMDIVYYQEQVSDETGSALKATPCYRFFVSDITEPFLVDAYSTVVK